MPYWQRAGSGLQRSANAEAISHLRQGLAVLRTLPDTPAQAQEELALQMDLGVALSVTQGFAAPEVAGAYSRAHALCQQVGDVTQRFPVLYSLWNFYPRFSRPENDSHLPHTLAYGYSNVIGRWCNQGIGGHALSRAASRRIGLWARLSKRTMIRSAWMSSCPPVSTNLR